MCFFYFFRICPWPGPRNGLSAAFFPAKESGSIMLFAQASAAASSLHVLVQAAGAAIPCQAFPLLAMRPQACLLSASGLCCMPMQKQGSRTMLSASCGSLSQLFPAGCSGSLPCAFFSLRAICRNHRSLHRQSRTPLPFLLLQSFPAAKGPLHAFSPVPRRHSAPGRAPAGCLDGS